MNQIFKKLILNLLLISFFVGNYSGMGYAFNPISACAKYLFNPLVKHKKNIKVALCQIDTTVGDFDYNVRHILNFIKKASELSAEVVVFPELAVSSYPPRDLLERSDFISSNEKALKKIIDEMSKGSTTVKTVIIGSVIQNPAPVGRALQNAALIIHQGKVVHTQAKQLLPNYDVFDEVRYFEPAVKGRFWKSPWGKVGCSVCEDAWYDSLINKRNLYKTDPAKHIRGANIVFSLNASPYEMHKYKHRLSAISGFVSKIASPLIYVNQVGAQDDILFDGRSFIYAENGNLIFEMPSFKEAIGVVEMELGSVAQVKSSLIIEWDGRSQKWGSISSQELENPSELENLERAIVAGIRGYFYKKDYERAVIGLSGGIDSSVVAVLAVEALGAENVIGVSMPSKYSSPGSLTDAQELAKNLGIKYIVSSIKNSVATTTAGLNISFEQLVSEYFLNTTEDDTTEDNIQARLRGVILTAIANKFDGLVLPTSNKSELSVGQTTLYGDMAGAFAPIGDLFKTRVYELARHLNAKHMRIPEPVLTKPASAELAPGQTDEAKFGAWSVLDPVLEMYIEKQMSESDIIAQGFDAEYVKQTIGIVRLNEFKRRQAPIILKVTAKAYGSGRRIPVTQYYRPVR